ncbi:hypothetical protein C8Q78DRAFT_231108 [Trametes maxima]|nr:hypothetical protein C8Q78DRAFT_231108 [Trametes maxima]
MELPRDIIWEKCVTQDGKEYDIGRPAPFSLEDSELAPLPSTRPIAAGHRRGAHAANMDTMNPIPLASGPPFSIGVHWPVAHAGAWDEWKPTSAEVNRTARIPRYNLYKYGTPSDNWTYMLQFSNADTYRYHFRDAEGDTYTVDTWRNGDHYLRFNSSAPTIVNVSGN